VQIVKSGSGCGPDIWGLYAKWHRINGDLTMCSEALLKQVRSLQVSLFSYRKMLLHSFLIVRFWKILVSFIYLCSR